MSPEHIAKMVAARKQTKSVSLRGAINRFCKDCGYDPMSGLGTWRQQIEGCTVKKCALWEVRPISKGEKE